MGNGPSNRRNGRMQQHLSNAPPPRMVPPPPGYPGGHAPHPGPGIYPSNGHHPAYFYPPPNYNGGMTAPMGPPQFYQPSFMPSNGQYMMNLQSPGFRPSTQSTAPQAHPPPPIAESQKANTIRNDVNLKKATLCLEKDEANPGFHLVAFSFDANVDGCISIVFLSKEKDNSCSFSPLKPHLYSTVRLPFEKGLVQKFQQPQGTGVNLAMFDERDLSKAEDSIYPLVVRTETVGKDAPPNFSLYDELPVGSPVPKYVHCQTTQAVIEKKEDGNYKVKVVRQTLWVDGRLYELQEIYGIENSGVGADFDDNDAGKECVICMSEPRDTTVLPCRHMCMCSECAKVLRFQTNRCPICRTPVEKLLEIKIPKNDIMDVMDAYGASASQSSAQSSVGQSSTHPNVDRSSSYPIMDQGSDSVSERASKEEIKV